MKLLLLLLPILRPSSDDPTVRMSNRVAVQLLNLQPKVPGQPKKVAKMGSNLVKAEKGVAPGELVQVLLRDGWISDDVENRG